MPASTSVCDGQAASEASVIKAGARQARQWVNQCRCLTVLRPRYDVRIRWRQAAVQLVGRVLVACSQDRYTFAGGGQAHPTMVNGQQVAGPLVQ